MSSALAVLYVKALAGGYIINALRRKKALIIAAVLILASAIGTALPPNFTTFWIFRIIGGLGVGLASLTVPVYISEYSCVSKLSVTLTGIPDSLK
ncbi:hypothetical protein CRW58_23805 [Salmonella enterica subsp. enterica serovar Newport]|nr:hypothetical protein [Salmonella enterica subsp. enterica serovar Newport]HED0311094.1 MFS transporter [Salmonella enterica subsp. enterica serovar Newport]